MLIITNSVVCRVSLVYDFALQLTICTVDFPIAITYISFKHLLVVHT